MTGPRERSDRPAPAAPAVLADEPPPFWGRWGRIYLLVAGLLLVETVVFWWLSRWAA